MMFSVMGQVSSVDASIDDDDGAAAQGNIDGNGDDDNADDGAALDPDEEPVQTSNLDDAAVDEISRAA